MRFLLPLMIVLFVACSDATSPLSAASAIDTQASADVHQGQIDGADAPDASKDQPTIETTRWVGTFGSTCYKGADCDSGFCIDTRDGKVCSKTCSSDCPTGFQCVNNSSGGGDLVFVCISRFVRLCDPCKQHSDCNVEGGAGNVCINHASAGSFCGASCQANADCLPGYDCQSYTDIKTGVSSLQCIPSQGTTCNCSARAILLGLSTACQNKNFNGTCSGNRTCTAQGLTSCIGQIPDVETCNNVDDDCDGVIDDVDPSAQTPCQKSNAFGVCTGLNTGCAQGKPVCNAPEPGPEVCNGKDDNCDGKTDEKLCDDGNECTTDACNTDGSCKHAKLTGTACDDQNVCTSLSQCASGVCTGGSPINCDDNDSCSNDFCDPFVGCVHKPSSQGVCQDDGNECTQDVCSAGACVHPSVKDGTLCATDGEVCTSDLCKLGECTHLSNTVACNDGNPCTQNDTCKDKICSVFTPKVCLDGNACTIDGCDPKIGCVFTPNPPWKDGVPCPDDGNPCTDDVCKGSTCSHIPDPTCD